MRRIHEKINDYITNLDKRIRKKNKMNEEETVRVSIKFPRKTTLPTEAAPNGELPTQEVITNPIEETQPHL